MSKTKITAIDTIIEYDDGKMVVINPGESGELSDKLAQGHIEGGRARAKKAGPLDHDRNGKAGGSLPGKQSTRAKGATKAKRAKGGAKPKVSAAPASPAPAAEADNEAAPPA